MPSPDFSNVRLSNRMLKAMANDYTIPVEARMACREALDTPTQPEEGTEGVGLARWLIANGPHEPATPTDTEGLVLEGEITGGHLSVVQRDEPHTVLEVVVKGAHSFPYRSPATFTIKPLQGEGQR